MDFKVWIENVVAMSDKIRSIISTVEALPDTDDPSNLWGKENKKRICLRFFNDILENLDDKLAGILSTCDLDTNYLAIYHTLNSPTHPVRNHLLGLSVNHILARNDNPKQTPRTKRRAKRMDI